MSTPAPSLVDELLQPLAGENPSGVSLRYEPIYDKIKELRRFPEAGMGGGIPEYDHKAVIKLATDALSKKSKDLQLAVWLVDFAVLQIAVRLFQRESIIIRWQ